MTDRHTHTPWFVHEMDGRIFIGPGAEDDLSEVVAIFDITGLRKEARQRYRRNAALVAAAVSAFHDGSRTIATEDISEGLFWQVYDAMLDAMSGFPAEARNVVDSLSIQEREG